MDSPTPLSLLIQLRNPNEAAWDRFVELYTPLLFYWTNCSGLQSHDAEELVQEVFIALLQALPNFRHDGTHSFRAWLRTVLKNKWTDLCRKRARLPPGDGVLSSVAAPSEIIDLEESEFRAHLIHRALELVQAEVGEQTIAVFKATAIENQPIAQVAAAHGVTENTIYSARRRVMQKLREQLEGMWN